MSHKHIYLSLVDVVDKKVFTEDKMWEWKRHIMSSYKAVFYEMKAKIDPSAPLNFFLNRALFDEVIIDAIIGMRKITDSRFNNVEEPNGFKVASYLAYWWLRHKPVSIHYPRNYSLEDVQIVDEEYEDMEKEQQITVWRLKHINELIAVQMVVTYIFRFDKVICGDRDCKKIKKKTTNFCFDNFEEMKTEILQKLTYYFSYRAVMPKVIEHILEGYSFHPAWDLTGKLWATE